MNNVSLIGRLTRDPDVRYTAGTQMAVARFTIAINRGKDRDGNDKGADFPSIVAFGKTAELCEKYLTKGRMVAIDGRIQTGSYEKDGRTVYTTDIVANRVEFLEWGDRSAAPQRSNDGFFPQDIPSPAEAQAASGEEPLPQGLEMMDNDEIPF